MTYLGSGDPARRRTELMGEKSANTPYGAMYPGADH
jgi:hypothetical protein